MESVWESLRHLSTQAGKAFEAFQEDLRNEPGHSTQQDLMIETSLDLVHADILCLGCSYEPSGAVPEELPAQLGERLEELQTELHVARKVSSGIDTALHIRRAAEGLERDTHKLELHWPDVTNESYRRDKTTKSQLDSIKLLQDWPRERLEVLFTALVTHLSSCCGNHIARLQLTDFIHQIDDLSRAFFHLYLHSKYGWMENKCTIQSPIQHREDPGCHWIQASAINNETLNLLVEDHVGGGLQWRQGYRAISPSAPTESLRDLILRGCLSRTYNTDHDCFLDLDKAVLCFNLSLSLLQLAYGNWRNVEWSVDTIFFLEHPGTNRLLRKDQPYLSWDIRNSQDMRQTSNKLLCDPQLLLFGRLLMEIHRGEILAIPDSGSLKDLRSRIKQLVNKDEIFKAGEVGFRDAVKACIQPAGRDAAADKDPAVFQRYIFSRIAKALEQYVHAWAEPSRGSSESTDTSISDDTGSEEDEEDDGEEDIAGNAIHEDQYESIYDSTEKDEPPQDMSATVFFSKLKRFTDHHIEGLEETLHRPLPPHLNQKVKVVIIDSGVNRRDTRIDGFIQSGRIAKCRNFVPCPEDGDWPNPESWGDDNGHGTHVACLLLNAAPKAEVYIAKVANGRTIPNKHLYCIANAIKWAVVDWGVDIISMSLVLEQEHEAIEKVLKVVLDPYEGRKIVLAAAGNPGGNDLRGWPASRSGVLAIHATNGWGVPADFNSPPGGDENFATLGCYIKGEVKPSRGPPRDVYLSGTSFATPIAAAIAANVLEYARHRLGLSIRQQEFLYSGRGMKEIFKAMLLPNPREYQYRYLQPWTLWERAGELGHRDINHALMRIIEQA